jgi:hypothetical protein
VMTVGLRPLRALVALCGGSLFGHTAPMPGRRSK